MELPQSPILIVDDNPNNLKILSHALRSAGWMVAIAKTGETALKQVKHTPPVLILLDVMMPGIDGFETCKILKADPETQEIPIIFTTALSDTVDKVKGLSIGAVDYITKPFQNEEVLARVKVHYQLYFLRKQLREDRELLEVKVAERTKELERSLKEKKQLISSLKATQLQVVRQEKMASVGQLAAGIAHEIHNPLTFLYGNIEPALADTQVLIELLNLYGKYYPTPAPEIAEKIAQNEINYILEDLQKMISAMKEGVERITEISDSMRNFSRSDTRKKSLCDIHLGLDSTLTILKHRLKATSTRPEIQIIKNYGNFPKIYCYSGELNQVFMNLIANGIDSLESKNTDASFDKIKNNLNSISIATEFYEEKNSISIRIKDNGVGMTPQVKERIFHNLFTTKPPGKGTGLGLAISSQIVEEKHGGKLECYSAVGEGSEFIIELPMEPEEKWGASQF
ncbi:MAG: hybrid sensor histidine kinase/response regulator [Cyanobacteriota bacterium]|nr:hybrid sensor histidine kinase/response regulator [Cyanobacteriota bacterium]